MTNNCCNDDQKIYYARKFVSEVGVLAKKYALPVFVVTDGASLTSNKNCEAVMYARNCHIEWEKRHGVDPYHSFSE